MNDTERADQLEKEGYCEQAILLRECSVLRSALEDFVCVCETSNPIQLVKLIGESCARAKKVLER